MVSANLKYRNNVPSLYYSIELCDLNFYGDMKLTNLLHRIRNLIKFERYNENKIKIEKLSNHKEHNFTKWVECKKEIKAFKREHLFWMLNRELREEMAMLKNKYNELGTRDENLSLAISQLEDSKFCEASEITTKYKRLLAELGFTCKTATRSDSNLHEEIYESTCSDEELLSRVETKLHQLEKLKEERQKEISRRYSLPYIIDRI